VAGFALDKAIAAAQVAILARLLTPADFGLMAASAVVLLALLTVSEMGVEAALVTREKVDQSDLTVAWALSIGRGVLLAGLLWLLAEQAAAFFRSAELASLLRVYALALVIQGVQSPALAVLSRNLELHRRVRLDLARRIVEMVATIGLALWLRNAWALVCGQLIGFTVGCALSYWIAPFRPSLSLNRDSLQQFLRFGQHVNLTTIMIFCVTSGGELVVGRLLGTAALGIYQVALTLPALIGTRMAIMMHQVSLPAYSMLRSDRARLAKAFTVQMELAGLILVPLAAVVATMAPDLVTVLFGSRWHETVGPLRLLCVYAVCAGFSGIMASLHYGMDRPDIQRRIWTVQFVVYAVVMYPLTVGFGVTGAAAALMISYAVGLFLHVRFTHWVLGISVWPALASVGRVGLVAAVITSAWLLSLNLQVEPQAAWTVGMGAVVAVPIYALYLWRVEYPRLRKLWPGSAQSMV